MENNLFEEDITEGSGFVDPLLTPFEDPIPENSFNEIEESGYWAKFEKSFLKKSGEHLLGVGQTGSGKTQKALYLVKKLLDYETIVWFDTGKSTDFGEKAELSPLFTFGKPVNIIIPAGMTLEITGAPVPVRVIECPRPGNIWNLLVPGRINIVMLSRFFLEPDLYAKYTSEAFKELIIMAQNRKDELRPVLPLAIFHDEFSDVAPGVTMALSPRHLHAAKVMAWNINKLRSIGIRICGFTQRYTFIYPNCRVAFSWILCCRGARFERDDADLCSFNGLYRRLDVWQAILWFPKRTFRDRWRFPLYVGPADMKIKHSGIMTNI